MKIRRNSKGDWIMDFDTFRKLDPKEIHKHLVEKAKG